VNRISGAFALITLAAAGVAAAQSQSMQPSQSQYPSSSTATQSDTASQSGKETKKEHMKDCIAQQQASNSGMSKEEARKACKSQMGHTSGHDTASPHD